MCFFLKNVFLRFNVFEKACKFQLWPFSNILWPKNWSFERDWKKIWLFKIILLENTMRYKKFVLKSDGCWKVGFEIWHAVKISLQKLPKCKQLTQKNYFLKNSFLRASESSFSRKHVTILQGKLAKKNCFLKQILQQIFISWKQFYVCKNFDSETDGWQKFWFKICHAVEILIGISTKSKKIDGSICFYNFWFKICFFAQNFLLKNMLSKKKRKS